MGDRSQWAADRLEIEDVISRSAWCIDQRDWRRLAEKCFSADVVLVYPSRGWELDLAGYISGAQDLIGNYEATQHLLTNFEVEIDGDEADAAVYVVGQHVAPPATAQYLELAERPPIATIGAIWRDQLRRGASGWRIFRRESEVRWVTADHPLGKLP